MVYDVLGAFVRKCKASEKQTFLFALLYGPHSPVDSVIPVKWFNFEREMMMTTLDIGGVIRARQ